MRDRIRGALRFRRSLNIRRKSQAKNVDNRALARDDSATPMKKFLERLFKRRPRKATPAPLFRSYFSHYNGQMDTMSGRDSLRNNSFSDR
jgi:hypothetical protein